MNKVCTLCEVEKPITSFHNSKSSKDGIAYWCKACVNGRTKEYNQRKRDGLPKRPKTRRTKAACSFVDCLAARVEGRSYCRDHHRLYRAIAIEKHKDDPCTVTECKQPRANRTSVCRYHRNLQSGYSRKKNSYGLSKEDIDARLIEQKNCCDLCGEAFTEKRFPCIDHNHLTGNVRGMIHSKCNLLLGHANDKTPILRQAIAYLTRYENE